MKMSQPKVIPLKASQAKIIPFRTLLMKQIAEKSNNNIPSEPLLIPYFDHRVVVLVNIENITGNQLLDLVEEANPSVVFDLRPCPRFDIESIDRSIFLNTLMKYKTKYLDLAGVNKISSSDDPKLHPLAAAKLISEKLYSIKIDGPILVFLDNSERVSNYSIAFPCSLKPEPANGWDVYPY